MSQFRMFFRWVGRAVLERNGAPPDPVVVAAAVIRQEGHDSQEDYRRTALAALAGASDAEVRATVDAVVRDLAADRPEAAHRLTDYLLRLPATVRRNLARPADPAGVSLPDGLPLRAPDDLSPFLPALGPDGHPAPLSDADRAASLELAVRAALEAGRKTGLRRKVVELLRLNPNREDLRKLLSRLPEEVELPERVRNSLGMELVLVPDGRFVMGSDEREPERSRDEPQHRVRVRRPFYLVATPVTQEQYERVMGVNPSYFTPGRDGGPRHPVECVSWEQAAAFCQRLSARADEVLAGSALPFETHAGHVYRLPTEAEWEYACRAGAETPFAFGVSLSSVQANFNGQFPYGGAPRGPYREATTPVGSFMPNYWGLYDLHGNVAEWCQDWYGEGYYRHAPRRDPPGPASGSTKVVRGGGWASPAAQCRSAARSVSVPTQRHPGIGFRVVLEVKG